MATTKTQAIADTLAAALKEIGEADLPVFSLMSPTKTSVLMKNNSYRTVPIVGGQEFFLKSVRGGARANLIFEFEPVDGQEYLQAEIDSGKVFNLFQGLEKFVIGLLGVDTDQYEDFNKACLAFWRAHKKAEAERQAAEAEANSRQEQEKYGKSDIWGMF